MMTKIIYIYIFGEITSIILTNHIQNAMEHMLKLTATRYTINSKNNAYRMLIRVSLSAFL